MNGLYRLGNRFPKLGFLTRVLIFKSVTDVLLVGVVSVVFYYSAFNPGLRGSLDEAGPEWIVGWALDLSKADARIEVQLYIDGRFQESRLADFHQPNLVTLGLAPDDMHGFFFYTPPLEVGTHEARVYAMHESGGSERRTLQQLGKALTFQINAATAEPYFKGWVEAADQVSVRGWVVDKSAPRTPVEVHLYIDNRFIEARTADYPRSDLKASLPDNEKVGFIFLPPKLLPGTHEVRVYAAKHLESEKTPSLRLIGRPLIVTLPPEESVRQGLK
ncbi:MAG TPA: hypothetical protein VGN86_09055 [Pyrinomonadaceae bacterium]|jgi:hypothetical protein|nr:hypothetical protein [Pyrinomonadaceae bacterium]